MQSQQASSRPSGISAHRDWRVPFASHHAAHQRKARRWRIALLAAGAIATLSGALSAAATSRGTSALGAAAILTNVALVAVLATCALLCFRPRLRCPHCTENIQRRWKSYCTECGSGKVHQPPFLGWRLLPRCDACGREPVRTRGGRLYAIRFCTHCGAYLHEAGV